MLMLPILLRGFPVRPLLWVMLSCCLHTGYAQSNYTITPFSSGEGLVSSEISTLFQDTHHFLWIGHTGGVSRYDGYQFEDFLSTPTRQLGKTHCITEDTAQRIWIGTESGLFLFAHRQLQHISFGREERPVYSLSFDKKGGLWIGTSDGPSYIHKEALRQTISTHQLSLSQYLLPAWKNYFPLGNLAGFISVGADGTAYFGDGYVVYKYQHEQIRQIWKNEGREDQLKSIIAVNKDTVYICSAQQGIQAVENEVYRRSHARADRSNLLIEKDGKLFHYASAGIYTVNRSTLDARLLFKLPDYLQEWGSCLLQDHENNFWIGTHEQLCHARRNFFSVQEQPLLNGFNELYTVQVLQDGSRICGGNLGATFRATNDTPVFQAWKQIFPRAQVTAIYQEKNGDTWFSSWYQGIALLQKDKLSRYTKTEGLRDNSNFIFLKDTRGRLFTAGDDGVSQIISDTQGQVRFRNYHFHTGSTDYVVIKSGIPAPGGSLLFGSNRGLLELKNDTLLPATIRNAMPRNYNITDMRRDALGNIWISTIGDGILICSLQNDTLVLKEQLTKKQGLASLVYLQLLIDRENTVWAVGYNGITRIEQNNTAQYFIATYGRKQGFLPLPFHTAKMLQDSTGIIWVATSSGLMKFDPGVINRTMYPSLQLADITLYDQQNAPITGNRHSGEQFPWQSNSIAFRYTGIYFSDPPAVIYAYRLLGLDSNWINAGNNQQAGFRHLQPGNYVFQVKAAAGTNRWSNIITYDFTIEPPFWQRWWFIILCVLTIAAIIYAIIRAWIKNIKQRLHTQQLILQNKNKAMEARLQSMRLQMNPHFLFNALNTIQQMILAGDEAVATRCLSKFSRLLRMILIHSDKEKITLREELETLQLYVELESFRFRDRFEHAITCSATIDQDETKIPTLLIQPFVENAIWHGLMHKEGMARLLIHFTEEENDTLVCIIEDNGIGRLASQGIKERSAHEHYHTGKGITIAAERLNIFNEHTGNGCSLEIIDLEDQAGQAAGTRIIVKFPA